MNTTRPPPPEAAPLAPKAAPVPAPAWPAGAASLRAQALSLQALAARLEAPQGEAGRAFDAVVDRLLACTGRVAVCGMGKSGHVGRKIAATLASTGTPAFFLHPAEALHGDLGMLRAGDVVMMISNSGETDELVRLLPALADLGLPRIALVGRAASTVARQAHQVLEVAVERESCPLNLAPTTSTLATLAMGDALAVALMGRRGFQPQDFARNHPGGSLGRRLHTRVEDVMHRRLPAVPAGTPLREAVPVMTEGRLGLALVTGPAGGLRGLLTDGDLRRALQRRSRPLEEPVDRFMSEEPLTIDAQALLADAQALMHRTKVRCLVVTRAGEAAPVGVLEVFC